MGGKAPKIPDPPPPPPPPPEPPKMADEAQRRARDEQLAEARRRAGAQSTIATGAGGLTEEANTAKKTLLGQ